MILRLPKDDAPQIVAGQPEGARRSNSMPVVITWSVKYFTLKHNGHVFPENTV